MCWTTYILGVNLFLFVLKHLGCFTVVTQAAASSSRSIRLLPGVRLRMNAVHAVFQAHTHTHYLSRSLRWFPFGFLELSKRSRILAIMLSLLASPASAQQAAPSQDDEGGSPVKVEETSSRDRAVRVRSDERSISILGGVET